MFCATCGKKETERGRGGVKRTVDPVTKTCNMCQNGAGNTKTGEGGAIRRNTKAADEEGDSSPTEEIPADLLNKSGNDLSATDIYRIVTSALQGTNTRIDQMDKNIQGKIGVLETRVKTLEAEGQQKDDEIERLKHTVVNIQKALNSIDNNQRSTNAIISGLSEDDIDVDDGNVLIKLAGDTAKIKYLSKVMEEELSDENLENITISRIGKERNGMNRMIKVAFRNNNDRDTFVKNSNKLKTAPAALKSVYVKKDQHPVYVAENNRLRAKMTKLRREDVDRQKTIMIKDGKLSVDGTVVDSNLFFR